MNVTLIRYTPEPDKLCGEAAAICTGYTGDPLKALRDAMMSVALRYPDIVMHIHDEMVVEVPAKGAELALRDISEIMGDPIPWAPGLLLRGDGYLCDFYMKD